MRVLIIDGTTKVDVQVGSCLDVIKKNLIKRGVEFSYLALKDVNIAYCISCRSCMQKEGSDPGKCVFSDNMVNMIEEIEKSTAYILICPTSLFTVNRVFRKFFDRLAVYQYWPMGEKFVKRRKNIRKKGLIITSNWAPFFIGQAFFNTEIILTEACELFGAKAIAEIYLDPLLQKGDDSLYIENRLNKLIS